MCLEWIEKFAAGRDWIAGVHSKSGNVHCHLAIRNADARGRCLNFKRADLYEMVSMSWTENAIPSKNTIADPTKRFVDAHLDQGLRGRTTYEAIRSWAETRVGLSEFQAGRRDKAGRLTSIVFGGVRHRLKTIARFIEARSTERESMEPPRYGGAANIDARADHGDEISAPNAPTLADFPRLRDYVRKAKPKKRTRERSGMPGL